MDPGAVEIKGIERPGLGAVLALLGGRFPGSTITAGRGLDEAVRLDVGHSCMPGESEHSDAANRPGP